MRNRRRPLRRRLAANRRSRARSFKYKAGVRFGARQRTRRRVPRKRQAAYGRLELKAYRAGIDGAAAVRREQRNVDHMRMTYAAWHDRSGLANMHFTRLAPILQAYSKGYASVSRHVHCGLPLPLRRSASAVVTVCNEMKTISAVLSELAKLPFREIIVVLNGCRDGSFAEVRKHPGVTILHFPERLGHDVGRSLGAAAARGDILLFTDGDLVIPAVELGAFLYAVDQGADLALNNITPWLPVFSRQDEVTRSKSFLNLVLGRPDLRANSLTAVPHALSRRAVENIGTAALAVPPKAQALAIQHGLVVTAPMAVDVIRNNRVRTGNTGSGNRVARMILGDHIEALGEAMSSAGPRLGFTSQGRAELAKARNSI
ncbi:glycosyltransferase [Paenibacillus sp. YPG26]|uniref:glycosyltransferase family 2 protein n=1 Tax=Paenibacillus sp. YPG26 TaxID=2878915 RepID=UPI00203E1D63|nr:glycosyltransferase [Paenibacillus sp. YPG26]USB32494.1 glycosyltransferase [Paenibacillus sp. YPG26]